jgi:CubicO group peptidase (beta-lactamase class C family)
MYRLGFISVLAPLLVAGALAQTPSPYPAVSWPVSTPEEQGIDSHQLAAVIEHAGATQPNIHSLAVVRNGFLVLDASFYPYQADTLHDLASVTKSVMATLVGIAVYKGQLSGVDQPLSDLFSASSGSVPDALKQMRLKHLLTMTSGWDCGIAPGEPELFRMLASSDWLRFTLELPVKNPPGTRFAYCSSGVHAVSVALREATGKTALQYAQDELFGPLGIRQSIWPADPRDGNNFGWGDLRLRPLDLARIGYLYLMDGVWDGKRILTSEWIDEATRIQVALPEQGGGYGYLWWSYPGAYAARGRGGQMLAVIPGKNLVVVMTGGGISTREILVAVDKSAAAATPLPANAGAFRDLQSKIENARKTPPYGTPAEIELPDGARRISGRQYNLAPNLMGWKSFVMRFSGTAEAVLEMSLDGLMGRGRLVLPVGLDGRHRLAPGRHGLQAALEGVWQDGGAFVLQFNEIGNINRWEIRFTFAGDGVTLDVKEKGGLRTFSITGSSA